jgi:hypothetical protein
VKTYRDKIWHPPAGDLRLWGYLLMLLVITLCVGLWPTTGHTEEKIEEKAQGFDHAPPSEPERMAAHFSGTVIEVINAGRHVYLHIDTGEKRVWVAVPDFDGKPGDEVLVPPGVPVADFQSRTLHRRFDMLYFVGSVRRTGRRPPE